MPRSVENRILNDARKLIGLRITEVRYMTAEECAERSIQHRAVMFTLSGGTVLYAMADDEGNDAGVLMARSADGRETHFSALPRLSRTRSIAQ